MTSGLGEITFGKTALMSRNVFSVTIKGLIVYKKGAYCRFFLLLLYLIVVSPAAKNFVANELKIVRVQLF